MNRIVRDRCQPPPVDWATRTVVIWEEDDAKPEGYETARQAMKRIAGLEADAIISTRERDDCLSYLYCGGWVLSVYPGGAHIAVVVKEVRL